MRRKTTVLNYLFSKYLTTKKVHGRKRGVERGLPKSCSVGGLDPLLTLFRRVESRTVSLRRPRISLGFGTMGPVPSRVAKRAAHIGLAIRRPIGVPFSGTSIGRRSIPLQPREVRMGACLGRDSRRGGSKVRRRGEGREDLPQRFTPKKLRPEDVWPRLPMDDDDAVDQLMAENRDPASPHYRELPDSPWFAEMLRTALSR